LIAASVNIDIFLLVLFLVGMFASGYGFGNWIESEIIEAHEREVDALSITIDELYNGLEMVYRAYTADGVTEEQAREAAERAEFLLTTILSPTQVEAEASGG
jgi:hypothetical protein